MIKKSKIRQLLIRSEKARKQLLQPYFTQIGLTFGQGHARILDTLMIKDHISQKELSDLCHMDVTTMSRSLDRLEEAGYLSRERDPESRRSFLVCLTEEGKEEARKVRRVLDFADARIWEGFTSQEMEQFCRCLERICENLESSPFNSHLEQEE